MLPISLPPPFPPPLYPTSLSSQISLYALLSHISPFDKENIKETVKKMGCNINISSFPSTTDISTIIKEIDGGDDSNDGNKNTDNYDDNTMIVDLAVIVRQYQNWTYKLPNITPHFAIKANPDPIIIMLLHHLGCHFDVASKKEMDLVLGCGVPSDKIIYANPCKSIKYITYARDNGVDLMVVDCVCEMEKIHRHFPAAHVLIRIKVDDSQSLCKFNSKYGVGIGAELDEMMEVARRLHIHLCGVSFHVGSGCGDKNVFKQAIRDSRYVIDMGRLCGFNMNVVDIGGGFPGETDGRFDEFANAINGAIEVEFGGKDEYMGVCYIAEPGRFFVSASHTLVTSVINRKIREETVGNLTNKTYVYYLLDGLYGVFSGGIYENAQFKLRVIGKEDDNTDNTDKKYNSIVFGPSCDSVDVICKNIELPVLDVGDQIVVENMGAYSVASAVEFNGFPLPDKKYIYS